MVGDDAATLADDERLFDEATSGDEPETEPELSSEEAAPEPPQGDPEPVSKPPVSETPQTPEPPPAAQEPVVRHVPLRELLDERDKRQNAERRAQETERILRELYAKQQASDQPAPEIWDKPDEYIRRQIEPYANDLLETKSAISRERAVETFGEELVSTAYQALFEANRRGDQASLVEANQIKASPHPWRGIVDWYKRNRVARDPDDLLKDPDFIKRAVESYNAQAAANPVTRQPSAAASLPSVSRAGTPAVPEDDADAYDKLSPEEQYDYWARDERGRFKGRS